MSKFSWGWGHSLKNYLLMFDLKDTDLQESILDVAAGASSFNAEMFHRGYRITSCDPLYANPPDKITTQVNKMLDNLERRIDENQAKFTWRYELSPKDLMQKQRAMANIFLKDYAEGLEQKRYLPDALPTLNFKDYQFALALCANFLFDGPYNTDLDFQLASIIEMCRVAREARIFPLLDDNGDISPHVGPIMAALQAKDYGVEVREVAFQLQQNGNAMLRIWPKECQLT